MSDDPSDTRPIDEDEPIPGSPRSRLSLVAGLLLLVGIVIALAWFVLHNTESRDATSIIGTAVPAGLVRDG